MTGSAAYLGLIGLGAALFPEAVLRHFGYPAEGIGIVLVKLVGGLCLGFAVLDWMTRGNLIGGIYSRPVAVGNFAHFRAAGIVLLQHVPGSTAPLTLSVAGGAFRALRGGLRLRHLREGR